ncbi:putative O-glycosylation ligase, exosortase A system-associated [Candidatus Uabimicrobium amorphum]|nr:putative O-glycosylation ligase, exosortase A system-associated [Candidatus Uabimicrobium amorphum]
MLLVVNVTMSGVLGSFIVPFYGLCVYIWFAYIRAQEWARNVGWFMSLRPSLLIALCIIMGCIIHKKKIFRLHVISVLLMLFWFWISICHFNSINRFASGFWMDFMNKLMISGCLIIGLVNTKRKMMYIFIPFVLSIGFYSSKSGLFGIIHPGAKIAQGPGGMMKDNNSFAMAFNMILPFVFFAGRLYSFKVLKLGLTFLFYLSIFGVVFTYSRGGFLGLVAVVILLQLKAKRNIFILVFGALFIGVIVFVSVPEAYKKRILTIFSSEEKRDKSAGSRLHFWKVAVIIANDNPIFGVGPGCFEVAYPRYDFSKGKFGKRKAVHSCYFQMLSNNGYPGLILFLLLIFTSLLTCIYIRWKVRKRRDLEWVTYCSNTFEVSIIAYCISGAFLSMAYADLIYHLFFLVVALHKTASKYLKNPLVLRSRDISSLYTSHFEKAKFNVVDDRKVSKQEMEAAKFILTPLYGSMDWNILEKKDFRDGIVSVIFVDEHEHLDTKQKVINFLNSEEEALLISSLDFGYEKQANICDKLSENINDYKTIVVELDSIQRLEQLQNFIDVAQEARYLDIPIICYQNTQIHSDREIAVYTMNEDDLDEENFWDKLREDQEQ